MAGVLRPALLEVLGNGDLQIHDYLLPEGRQALNAAVQKEGLDKTPPEVSQVVDADSYFLTFMTLPERKLVLVGHPPRQMIKDALTLPGMPARLLMGQEDMHSAGVKYEVWDFKQRIASFPIDTPLSEALEKGGMMSAGKPTS